MDLSPHRQNAPLHWRPKVQTHRNCWTLVQETGKNRGSGAHGLCKKCCTSQSPFVKRLKAMCIYIINHIYIYIIYMYLYLFILFIFILFIFIYYIHEKAMYRHHIHICFPLMILRFHGSRRRKKIVWFLFDRIH